jgi:hypothetical protein
MNSIFIHHHLGLGDHIVCNGMVRTILDRDNADCLYLPVKLKNLSSVKRMYFDEQRIICLPVQNDREVYNLKEVYLSSKVYRVGFEKTRKDWDVSFYDSVGIPFEKRWSSFKCYRDKCEERKIELSINPEQEPFVLVHNTGSNETFDIQIKTNIKIIKVMPISDCLLDWCGMIEKAKDIYCIDSSFIHLCQSLGVNGTFCDFKRQDRDGDNFVLLPSWRKNG